ncbi:uncharacterized protein LOC106672195 isoform X2 [Cimex lectularius]|uniref:Uncharacterized protein n=1 Tax=Cimex lectularius TaxID=79782 RepID=A0A8I6ST53_CIMLE|nr:uncharacterized protein LOC106672195 isoform X2 [Cimex lectularius]
MGCTSSSKSKTNGKLTAEEGADLLDTYMRLDRDIFREERSPPAPALGHAMVKLDRLTTQLDLAMMDASLDHDEHHIAVPGTVPEIDTTRLENYDDSIRRVLHELSLNRMPDQAMEHEEFISTLNRKAMKQHRIFWLNRRKQDAQDEVTRLSERVQHLQNLYQHHDTLTNSVGSPKSELRGEADRLRSYRDTLYSGELSWKEAGRLVQAAATLGRSGVDSWSELQDTLNTDSRWTLAQAARNCIHEALLCINAGQAVLPGVQFPYCSQREIQTVHQVLEYLYTDMQIPERYKHAANVYSSFQKRTSALYQWINKMVEETIHKDLVDVDQKLAEITRNMTNQTVNNIRQMLIIIRLKEFTTKSLDINCTNDTFH